MSKKTQSETQPQIESEVESDSSATTESSPTPELASLMQVREILTGPIATDVEHRLTEMNQRLDQTLQEFTDTSAKRMTGLERSCKDEMGQLSEELRDQRVQHQDRFERLERELSMGLEQMRGNLRDVTDQLSTTTDSLRSELGKEFDVIRGSIEELFTKVTDRIDQEKYRVRDEMVDRDTLSAALSEVAIRLAPPPGEAHEIDPSQSDLELDQILENATSGQG